MLIHRLAPLLLVRRRRPDFFQDFLSEVEGEAKLFPDLSQVILRARVVLQRGKLTAAVNKTPVLSLRGDFRYFPARKP